MTLLVQLALVLIGVNKPVKQNGCELSVEINGIRNTKGNISISLFRGESGFPDDAGSAVQWKKVKIEGSSVSINFDGLAPGEYAFCLLHDENGNDKMDYSWMGFPKEGYACSNDAVGKVKPPRFKNARMSLSSGKTQQSIEMIYW